MNFTKHRTPAEDVNKKPGAEDPDSINGIKQGDDQCDYCAGVQRLKMAVKNGL